MQSLLINLRNLSMIVFFISLSWGVWRTVQIIDGRTQELVILSTATKTSLEQEIHTINDTVKLAIRTTDSRLSSIEDNLMQRVDSIESNTFRQFETSNRSLELMANSALTLSEEHQRLAREATSVIRKTNTLLDCRYNDLCLPNLMTDVMIDTRNMVRNGSKTFQNTNTNVLPKLVADIDKVSTALASGFPKIVSNTEAVSNNINRLTKPKWYDRAISWGINGSLLYFNINRGRLGN